MKFEMLSCTTKKSFQLYDPHATLLCISATRDIEQRKYSFKNAMISSEGIQGCCLINSLHGRCAIFFTANIERCPLFRITQNAMCLCNEPELIRIPGGMIVGVVPLGKHTVHTIDCFLVGSRT